eukprot:scaffold42781_cov68-Phaeocystis_antarctica.AAC.3
MEEDPRLAARHLTIVAQGRVGRLDDGRLEPIERVAPEAVRYVYVPGLVEARPGERRVACPTVDGVGAADEPAHACVALAKQRALGAGIDGHGEACRCVAVVVERDKGLLTQGVARDRMHPHAARIACAPRHAGRALRDIVLPR